jgi:hypothetical protein
LTSLFAVASAFSKVVSSFEDYPHNKLIPVHR